MAGRAVLDRAHVRDSAVGAERRLDTQRRQFLRQQHVRLWSDERVQHGATGQTVDQRAAQVSVRSRR